MLYYTCGVKKMKYCELNAGDWFTDTANRYRIKTNFNGKNYALSMENTRLFGMPVAMSDNAEVNFVSSHTVDLPNPYEKNIYVISDAPRLTPLYPSATNDVIVLRYFNSVLHYVVVSSIWDNNELGIWRPVENLNDFVYSTPTFEYQVYEE